MTTTLQTGHSYTVRDRQGAVIGRLDVLSPDTVMVFSVASADGDGRHVKTVDSCAAIHGAAKAGHKLTLQR